MNSIRLKFLLVAFQVILLKSYGYQTSDSIQFEHYIQKTISNPEQSLQYFEKARELQTSPVQEVRLNRLIAEYYLERGAFDVALENIEKSNSIQLDTTNDQMHFERANQYLIQGKIQSELNRVEEASSNLNLAIRLLEARHKTANELQHAYHAFGKNFRLAYRVQEAKNWMEKALNWAVTNDLKEELFLSYVEMGLIYHHDYQPELARNYMQYALSVLDRYPLEDERLYRVVTINGIAMTFDNEKKYDSAINRYQQALALTREPGLSDYHKNKYLGAIYSNISSVYYGMYEVDQAISYARKALKVQEDFFGKDHMVLVATLRNLGESLREGYEYEAADLHLNRSLLISKNNKDVPGVINTYNALAMNNIYRETLAEARSYCDSAIAMNTYVVNGRDEHYDHSNLFYSWYMHAITILLDEEATIGQTDSVYQNLKSSLLYVQNKFRQPQISGVIPSALEFLFQVYQRIHQRTPKSTLLHRMWEISELNKAIELRNQFKEQYSLTYSVPEEVRLLEKTLKDSINVALSKHEPTTFDSTLFLLNRRYDQLKKEIATQYPRYAALRNETSFINMEDRRSQLLPNQAYLNFFQGVDNTHLITLYQDTTVQVSISNDSIASLINQMNEGLMSNGLDLVHQSSRIIQSIFKLEELSIKGIDQLIIVPDGHIWKLNFAALAMPTESNTEFFGNQFTLSFQYYADTVEGRSNRPVSSEVLAFSYSEKESENSASNYFSFRDLGQSIPGTSAEVKAISDLWKGDYYFAGAANETRFKEKGKAYGILHLAVHGYMDEAYPENSFLQFSNSDSLNDGKLHAYELYNLDLNAELAVISACNSGDGKIQSGEGMMSISRAFAFAGVESLLASRWEVPDVSAPHLMKHFYIGLKQGMKKSEALVFAQKEYLKKEADNITAAPYYWAGFYVIGDDSPIQIKSTRQWWMYLLIAIGMIIICIFLFRKYKTQLPTS